MRDVQSSVIERMIYAARSCPDPRAELRRRTLATAVRAYHDRVYRRRLWVAASLLLGTLWVAGSAQKLLAQPGRALVVHQVEQAAHEADALRKTDGTIGFEWRTMENTLQSRFQQSRTFSALLGPRGGSKTRFAAEHQR